MPFVNVNNTRLFYRLEGRSDLPMLALSHSLGCDHSMWAPQMPDLLDNFQVLRYDTRGHGASDVPAGDYTMDQLGQDVLGLLDALKVSQAAFCGLSMGGAIGQWLALNASQRLSALVLANTAPKFGMPDLWDARRKSVLEDGMAAVADAGMQRFFSADNQSSSFAQSTRAVLLGTDPKGYAACCAALRDADFRAELTQISVPTLVIGSDRDPSTPWEGNGSVLAKEIPGAQTVRLNTAHLSNLEQPRSFTTALLDFLLPKQSQQDPFQEGIKVRRKVLGAEHV
ncbi:MAG TPA: 3-oxoadipate enol-lactonase, partial [Candidatus Angelobacter sp.]|nr:3-oxoadipate enol-lactonase [Candidatus Angelobacter sp.]